MSNQGSTSSSAPFKNTHEIPVLYYIRLSNLSKCCHFDALKTVPIEPLLHFRSYGECGKYFRASARIFPRTVSL